MSAGSVKYILLELFFKRFTLVAKGDKTSQDTNTHSTPFGGASLTGTQVFSTQGLATTWESSHCPGCFLPQQLSLPEVVGVQL